MDMYKNIKHSCTFADLRHLCVRDSLLCVFICSKISINCNGWLGHLIGSVNCDVTGPLWRHQKAVSCLGWDKSISDTLRLSRIPGCTRQLYQYHALQQCQMTFMVSQINGQSSACSTVCSDWQQGNKGLCYCPFVTGGFPTQRDRNSKNVSISWCHNDGCCIIWKYLTPQWMLIR